MSPTARPLIPEQRHQEILRLLRREGVLSIRSLTDYMNVSHMTVRRDITALEDQGQVADHGRVRGNVTVMLHDGRSSFLDRIEHFCAAIEPMHFEAHAVAGLQIGFDCFANRVSGNLKIERCSLHHRQ